MCVSGGVWGCVCQGQGVYILQCIDLLASFLSSCPAVSVQCSGANSLNVHLLSYVECKEANEWGEGQPGCRHYKHAAGRNDADVSVPHSPET